MTAISDKPQADLNLIDMDLTDKLFYEDYRQSSEELQKIIETGRKKNFSFPSVSQDLFALLYKMNPQFKKGNVPSAIRPVEAALQQIVNLPEYKNLRAQTRLDPFAAGIGTRALSRQVLDLLPSIGPKSPDEIKAELESLKNISRGDPQGNKDNAQRIQKLQEQLNNIDNQEQMRQDELRQQIRAALNKTSSEISENTDALRLVGFDSSTSDQLNKVGLQEKMQIAERMKSSTKLQEIMKLAGRFSRIARKKQQEKFSASEVSTIEQGNALDRVLASGLVLLRNPLLRKKFYADYQEKKLLQYKLEGKEPQGKGPIIICIDSSGSMSGMPELASKGIALALLEVARKEKRDFVMIQFSSASEITIFKALNGRCETLELLSELETFIGGGTDYNTPLSECLNLINENAFKKADIIFISDGECTIDSAFLADYHKAKKEKEFSCFGILIGHSSTIMPQFCDQVFETPDLLNTDQNNDSIHESIFKV